MNKLVKGNLVRGLPSKLFKNDQTCVACQKGKQHRASCKSKIENSISLPLHLLHMDLFGPTFVKSLMKKMYCLVVTDDYSRFTWVFFLATKDETSGILKSFITGIENLVDHKVKVIRSRTPQQNEVAKRRNRTLIEAARTMLADSKLPTTFWAEVVNTACYVPKRGKAFRVINSRTRIVEENLHIKFSESTPNVVGNGPNWLFDIDALTRTMNYEPIVADPKSSQDDGSKPSSDDEKKVDEDPRKYSEYDGAEADMNNLDTTIQVSPIPTTRIHKDHPLGIKWMWRFAISYIKLKRCQRNLKEHGFFSPIYQRQTNKGLQKLLVCCFVSHEDPSKRFIEVKTASTPMETQKPLLKDEDGEEVDVHMYRSMIGSLIYLTSSKTDIMFAVCKKQTVVANSTTEAEYVAASSCCGQVPQPSDPSDNVADEAVHKELGDNLVRAANTASSLEAEQDSGNITKTRSKETPNESSSLGTTLGGGPRCQETIGDTITQTRVLDLEKIKTTQANEITSLKRRDKKLEKKIRSRTHKLKRLYKVGLTARVESSRDEQRLGEDASKQGRINAIDADDDITLVSVQDDADKEMFDADALNSEEVFVAGQNENVVEEVVDVAQVSTAAITIKITTEEITLAQALEALKTLKSKDKGKGIIIEEPLKPMKKKDLIRLDEEVALKLQAKFDEEERLAREKVEKEKEANIALIEEWDDIQAKIDDDYQLAERTQAQEQEELSDAEKATLFQQLLEKRRKHFAAKRAENQRNKPPTQAQQRKIMCTYQKNMEGKKLKDLKNKSFDSIQKMFNRAFKRVNTFVDFRIDLVEGSSKRVGEELEQESTKKQKVDKDKDTAELQSLIERISDEKEVAIDVVPLATKPLTIVDWK
ncbi:putative ribonuclease H-like domain-containing protein, partial [Tanacetum coccineum]